jgi:hypothetical protein
VQIASTVRKKVGHICPYKHVERHPLTGLLDKRYAEFTHDLAAGTIAAEQVPRLDLVRPFANVVENFRDDDVS